MKPARIIIIGEAMVELSSRPDGGYGLGFGGDTLNTAIYVSRLLGRKAQLSYLTKVGGDIFSAQALRAWAAEGINLDLTEVVADRTIGLYAIATDTTGERSFTYWRDASPARDLLDAALSADAREPIVSCDLLYFSGISLAILSENGRQQLLDIAAAAKAAGACVVFDPNHRPRLWHSREEARDTCQRALGCASMVLTSWDEQMAVFGDTTRKAVTRRLTEAGVAECVLRDGSGPITLRLGRRTKKVNFDAVAKPIDTTGAGDSFNAAYLSARLCGLEPVRAAKLAQSLAAEVIMHPGAIIPRETMPEATLTAFADCQPVCKPDQAP